MLDNRETHAIWNGQSGEDWARHQPDLDHFLAGSVQALRALLPLAPGAKVLEIGSGAGTLSLALARDVGPRGRVLGLDVSERLLGLSRRRAAGQGNLEFRSLDIQVQDPGVAGFDCAVSHIGMMFFSDPVTALARLRRCLRSGARVAFNGWSGRNNPWFSLPLDVARRHLGEMPPTPPAKRPPPGPLAFADVTYVTGILQDAGYCDCVGAQWEVAFRHPEGLEALMRSISYVGPISTLYRLKQPDAALRARIEAEIAAAFAPFVQPDGSVCLSAEMCFYTATTP